jgi:hypothetical protein
MYIKVRYNIVLRLLTYRNIPRSVNVSNRNYSKTILKKDRFPEIKRVARADNLYI